MQRIKSIIISLRPKQWIKNLFVFLPLLFFGRLFDPWYCFRVTLSFACFTLASCSIYLLNDIMDREEDRIHPLKSKRPIAGGRVSSSLAISVSALFLLFSFSGAIYIMKSRYLGLIIAGYIILNIFYTLYIKHVPILDVFSIAFGFELRIWAGAVVIGILPSLWLQICTFILALFLGFAKRRGELLLLTSTAGYHRKVLTRYRYLILDEFIAICAGLAILTYALYTLSRDVFTKPRGNYMVYTVPFVVYGILRYLYLTHTNRKNADPTEIVVTDKPLVLDLLLWFFSILIILYL